MIDKDDAQKQGFQTLNRSETRLTQRDELFQKLKAILPGLIDSDNLLNIKALEDAVDLSDTTANNQGYELTFAGKGLAKAKAEVPTDRELKVESGQSKNFDATGNVLVRGDNLDVLKILKQNYTGKIKCIYIDPPYNTESDDFVYSDNFRQSEEQLIADFGLKEETVNFLNDLYKTKTHSGWLAFMYPRLKLARSLLTDDGVIFISIDDKEQANLKILCDEIFGEDNFVNNFMWLHGKGKKNKLTRTLQQYIFCYAYDINRIAPWTLIREGTSGKKDNPDNDPRGEWFSGSISFSEERSNSKHKNYYEISSPSNKKWRRQWQRDREEMEELLQENKIFFGLAPEYENVPRIKIFDFDALEIIPENIIDDVGTTKSANTYIKNMFDGILVFDNPKPVELVKHIINILNISDNDLILDFFAGSGTTGEAVMRLNAEDGGGRRFILAQWDEAIAKDEPAHQFCIDNGLQPVISSITLERLRRAGAKIGEERKNKANLFADAPLDTGFRVFSLAPKREIAEENGQYSIANAGLLTPMDRLYNLLAFSGKPLDTPIEEIEKDTLYEAGGAVYILGKPKAGLEKYRSLHVFIDGYADISLEQFLNITAAEKENVRIVY